MGLRDRRLNKTEVWVYVNMESRKCPFCHRGVARQSTLSALEESGVLEQEMECLVCKARWWNRYKLVGMSQLDR